MQSLKINFFQKVVVVLFFTTECLHTQGGRQKHIWRWDSAWTQWCHPETGHIQRPLVDGL